MPHTPIVDQVRRDRLLARLKRGDVHGFLAAAEPHLAEVPEDAEVRQTAIELYAALGLASAARRLLDAEPSGQELRRQLAGRIPQRDRRVPWSKLDRQFQTNLEVFERRTGLGAAVERLWRSSAAQLQLHNCSDGNYQVYSRLPEAPGWLPALAAHNRMTVSNEIKSQMRGQVISTIAVNGLGLGHLLKDLIEVSRETYLNFSAPLIVIEPSLLAWAVVLHLHDWRRALDEQRVRICAGPHALTVFDGELRDVERTLPLLFTSGSPWPGAFDDQQVAARVERFRSERQATQRRLFEQVSATVAQRDRAWWARRFARAGAREPPLTIIGVTSRYTTVLQYTMRDLLAAFERLGHRTHLFVEKDDHAHFSPLRLLRDIQRLEPDLLLIIDHLRAEYQNLFPDNIPGVCWIQDQLPHLFTQAAGHSVRPLEFIIGHGVVECLTQFGYPPDRFYPCLIPTSPEQMSDPHERAEDLEPYRCDVMFASNASASPGEFHARSREQFTDATVRRLYDAAVETLMADLRQPDFTADHPLAQVIERAQRALGLRVTDEGLGTAILGHLRTIADRWLREDTLRAAARWADASGGRFHLYGRGWEERREFARFARGVVPHGKLLGRAYRAAKISLHAGCNPALHQRVLEGLCAGGFFLIRRRASDTLHGLRAALYRHIRGQRLRPPLHYRAGDLPAPYDAQVRRLLADAGRDPEERELITPARWLKLRLEHELGCLPTPPAVWPCLERVLFRDATDLPERIEHFLRHEQERRQLAGEMRAAVLERFTYDALARNVLGFLHKSLAGQFPSLLA